MKRLLLLFCLMPFILSAQKIEENKVDEFTGNKVIRTSWEKFEMSMKASAYFRISQINEDKVWNLKLILGAGGSVFAIDKEGELMFKLMGGEIVTLKSLRYTITGIGDGAVGFVASRALGIDASYFLDEESFKKLSINPIEKVRIYTTDGYTEFRVAEKVSKRIHNALALLTLNN